MEETVRTVIIDDEPLARDLLRRYISRYRHFKVVGESGTGRQAAQLIRLVEPHLIFLDVQLADMDGFELLEKLDRSQMPFVILVTAYEEYAQRAFDVHAVDYLVKPFDEERFFTAISRAFYSIHSSTKLKIVDRIIALLSENRFESREGRPQTFDKRLAIEDQGGRTYFVDVSSIEWVEAAGNYVCIHAGPNRFVLRKTLNELHATLDPKLFVRIHRSFIVNADYIVHIQAATPRKYTVQLASSQKLPVSRSYKKNLRSSIRKG